jgi:hypothetical protein
MSDATVKLGWDNSAARAGAAEAVAIAQQVGVRSEKALSKVGLPSSFGMQKGGAGQIAMQIQDIAVQAQAGTSALTIFAQQGPQIMGAFGELGAIAGGFAAVGGAAIYAGMKSSEAMREMLNETMALSRETALLAQGSASLESLIDVYSRLADQRKKLSDAAESKRGSLMEMLQEVAATVGLAEGNFEQRSEADTAGVVLKKQQLALQKNIVSASEQEVELAELRAQGDEKSAEKLERYYKMQRQIADIQGTEVDEGTKAKLINNAIRLYEISNRQKAESFDIAKSLQDQVNFSEQLLAPYREFLSFLEQAKTKQDALTNAAKAQRALDAAKGKQESTLRADAEKELEILRMKASGQDETASAMEKQLAIQQQARQIADSLNVSYKKALEMARERVELEEKIKKSQEQTDVSGRIQGFSAEKMGGRDEARNRAAQRQALSEAKRGAAYERGFGGLDDFYADQKDPNFARAKTPILDAAFGKRQPLISTEKLRGSEGRGSDFGQLVAVATDTKTVQERIAAAVELLSVA